MLLEWKVFWFLATVVFVTLPAQSGETLSRQKRGGLLNIGVKLDVFGSSRRQHGGQKTEGRILPLPPGNDKEDHGAPIKDQATIQSFLNQLELHRRRTSQDNIPILGGVVKNIRRFQACATPKYEAGHCRHVQHCVLPVFLRDINVLLSYACFIGGAHLGVCCPDRHFDDSGQEDEDDEPMRVTTARPSLIQGIVKPIKDIISPSRPVRPETPTRPDRPEYPEEPVPTSTGVTRPEPSYEDDREPYSTPSPPTTARPSSTTPAPARDNTQTETAPTNGSQITKYESTCGLNIKSRIVGGEVANKELWSWIVSQQAEDVANRNC